MSSESHLTPYSVAEERLNTISHGIAFVISVIGLIYLLLKAKDSIAVSAVSLYGVALMMMFLTSTLYHGVENSCAKKTLKLFDHSAIYILIAGTNTPFLLISIGGTMGMILTIVIWLGAVFGVAFKCWSKGRYPKVSVATYLLMGWFALSIIYPLYNALAGPGFVLLVAGGVLFNIGVLFYIAKQHKYTHAIWHLFVIGGCSSHYFAIYYYVL